MEQRGFLAVCFVIVFLGIYHMDLTKSPSAAADLGEKIANIPERMARFLRAAPADDVPSRMARLQREAQSVRKEIEARWGVSPASFSEALSRGIAWQRAEDDLLNALAAGTLSAGASGAGGDPPGALAAGSGGRFVFAFLGSSVTAGHDNFFNQSYPQVMERVLAPVFALGGVELVVRNQAMGGAPCLPSALCVETLAGPDINILGWEYDMMMGRSSEVMIETALRNAAALPNTPSFLYIHADAPIGPARPGKPQANNTGKPLPPPEHNLVLDYYGKRGYGNAILTTGRAYWGRDHEHPFTNRDFQAKDKPWGPAASWHPGPIGHRFRGDVLAHNYLSMLQAAALRLSMAHSPGAPPPPPPSRNRTVPLKLPAPYKCDPRFCARAPTCLTTYEPRFVQDSLNVAPHAHNGWKLSISGADVGAVKRSQERSSGYRDYKIVWMSHFKNESDVWLSLHLPAVGARGGSVWVCEASTGWKYPKEQLPLSSAGEVRLSPAHTSADAAGWTPAVLLAGGNGTSVMGNPTAPTKPERTPLCSQLLLRGEGGGLAPLPPGRHAMHVRVGGGAVGLEVGMYASFAQVIVW